MTRTIQEKIQILLRERGFRRKDLATAMGISASTLGEILQGRQTLTVNHLQGLIGFFGLRADYWLDDARESPTTEDMVRDTEYSAEKLKEMGITRISDVDSFKRKMREFVRRHPAEWAALFGPLSREEQDLLAKKDEE